jgi:type I site-specific restriction-modification system R (restriction) subunit
LFVSLAQDHVLSRDNNRDRFVKAVLKVTNANALCGTPDAAIAHEAEIAFYQAVKAALIKVIQRRGKSEEELELAPSSIA